MTTVRIALFAYSQIGVRVLETLLRLDHAVVHVVTHTDRVDEVIWFDSMASHARARGLALTELPAGGKRPSRTAADAMATLRTTLERAQPDLILSASFRSLIPLEILSIARKGALNLHGSLLPRYRGRAPLNWVLVNGESETGMTLHHMTDVADAGDVVARVRLPIGEDETAPELARRLEDAAEHLLERMLGPIEQGTAPRLEQDEALATTFPRRRPADGRFAWTWSARRIHDLVRAVTRPYPGAYCQTERGKLFVWRTRVAESKLVAGLRPGDAVTSDRGEPVRTLGPEAGTRSVVVATGGGALELLEWELREGEEQR